MKSELEQAVQLDPNLAAAYHALALWHLEVPFLAGGRSGEVRPLFDIAIELEPQGVVHYVDYGEALLRLDDPEAARMQFEAALAIAPASYSEEQAQAEARELLAGLE